MTCYPIAVAGIFAKQGDPAPICSICFFATSPSGIPIADVEDCICSDIFPALAQIVANSNAERVSAAIDTCACQIEARFGVECEGYLNEACVSGTTRINEGSDCNV